jgi:dGTPase
VPADLAARRYAEPIQNEAPPYGRTRTSGERDRDRVLYCSAFQRLAGITQVVPAQRGQSLHSRLTHSIKVAHVARRLAQRLIEEDPSRAELLDPDMVEAAALAHDIGHPPFGHIAEKVLDDFVRLHGCDGFEGNAQSFRVVTRLAQRWTGGGDGEEWGLNLSRGTLDGILKYPWQRKMGDPKKERKWSAYVDDLAVFEWVREGAVEDVKSPAAEVMDWADDVTYAVHDMEDFFRAGLVPIDRLCISQTEREGFCRSVRAPGGLNSRLGGFTADEFDDAVDGLFELLDFTEPFTGGAIQRQRLRERSSFLIREMMRAFRMDSEYRVTVERGPATIVAVLKELIWSYVIKQQELATVQHGQQEVVDALTKACWDASQDDRMELFPPLERHALRVAKQPSDAARVVADFIARMTEERAIELHRRLLGVTVPALVGPQV